MKKLKLFAVALMACFSMGAMAETKTYSFDDGVDLETDWTVTTDVPSGGTANCLITDALTGAAFSAKSENYLGLSYLNKSGITISIVSTESYLEVSNVTMSVVASDNSKPNFSAYLVNDDGEVVETLFANIGSKDGFATGGTNKWGTKSTDVDSKTGHLKIVTYASSSGKYAAIDDIVITHNGAGSTPSTDPVESATITGPEAGFVGIEATYKVTAAGATDYAWYVNGVAQDGETAATFKYTPAAEGSYAIYATATNEYTATPVQSNTITLVSAGAISGEIIKATHVNKNTATVTGIIGGTADKSTQDNGKLGSNGHYFGIKLATGMFLPDDSVIVVASALNGGNTATFFSDKGTAAIGSADFDTETMKAVFVLSVQTEWIYLYREAAACNPTVESISVIRPVDDGNPRLSASVEEVNLNVTAENANPTATVVFSGKNLAAGNYALTVPNVAGLSVEPASVTVGENGKLNATVTLTYASDVDVDAATAEIKLTIGELEAAVAINYSAVHAKAYMTSVNFEQQILTNGLKVNRDLLLAAANIAAVNIDALDSLNDEKANRNYPYLGLKMKKEDARLSGWLTQGSTVKVRFGNVGANFKVAVNGAEQTLSADDYANATVDDANELVYTASDADAYIEIICGSTKTLVVKQIMIDEDIQAVVLPESPVNPDTAIDDVNAEVGAVKFVENGQIYILKNGVRYNALGAAVK
ncbi:MAG: hypothetical protein IJS13_08750 [Paludibacteraceae bacterium]|nr:hypothetical protein [Paludibacteraceae bacterium]